MRLGCENSKQVQVWNMTKRTWQRLTDRGWPTISLGLIGGVAALVLKEDLFDKDSERLRILITMTTVENSIMNMVSQCSKCSKALHYPNHALSKFQLN